MNFFSKLSSLVSDKLNTMMYGNSAMGGGGVIPAPQDQLLQLRQMLVNAIYNGEEHTALTFTIASLDLPIEKKYALLSVRQLLELNGQSLASLQCTVTALNTCLKFAKHLVKDKEKRTSNWRKVSFNNKIVDTKLKPMQGFESIFALMGYTEQDENSMSFGENGEPDQGLVVNLMVDIILLKAEIIYYIQGLHRQRHYMDALVSKKARDEITNFQASGNDFEGEDIDMPMTLTPLDYASVDTNNQQNRAAGMPGSGIPQTVSKAVSQETEPSVNIMENNDGSALLNQRLLAVAEEEFQTNNSSEEVADAVPEVSQDEAMQDLVDAVGDQSGPNLSGSGRLPSSSRFSCDVCGEEATVFCHDCQIKPLCDSCNQNWHKHPQRRNHRIDIISALHSLSMESPTGLQIDGAYGITAQERNSPSRVRRQPNRSTNQTATTPSQALPSSYGASEMLTGVGASESPSTWRPYLQYPQESAMGYQQRQHMMYQNQTQVQGLRQPLPLSSQHAQPQMHMYQHQYSNSSLAEGGQLTPPYPSPNSHMQYPYSNHPLAPMNTMMLQGTPTRPAFNMMSSVAQSGMNMGQNDRYGPYRHSQPQMPIQHQGQRTQPYMMDTPPQDRNVGEMPNYMMQQLHEHQRELSAPRMGVQGQSQISPSGDGASGYTSGMYASPMMGNVVSQATNQSFHKDIGMGNAQQDFYNFSRSNPAPQPGIQMQHVNSQPMMNMMQNRDTQVLYPLSNMAAPSLAIPSTNEDFYQYKPQFSSAQHFQNHHQYMQTWQGIGLPQNCPIDSTGARPKVPYNMGESIEGLYNNNGRRLSTPSTPLTSSSNTGLFVSKLVSRLMNEPDPQKRQEKCNRDIEDLGADIQDLDKEINEKIAEFDDDFTESDEYRDMTKRKKNMLKERKALEAYRSQLDQETTLVKLRSAPVIPISTMEQVHLPPSVDIQQQKAKRNSQLVSSASTRTAVESFHLAPEPNSTDLGSEQQRPSPPEIPMRRVKEEELLRNFDMRKQQPQHGSKLEGNRHSTSIIPDALSDLAKLKGQVPVSKASELRGKSKIPVEDGSSEEDVPNQHWKEARSSPPPLPPRHSMPNMTNQGTDLLRMSFPPPKNPTPVSKRPKQWHCDHCTFINDDSSHVCLMCHKTSDNPLMVSCLEEEEEENQVQDIFDESPLDSGLQDDPFIDLLCDINAEQKAKVKKDEALPVSQERQDKAVEAAERIAYMQDQVMIEKKKAHEEFYQKQLQRGQEVNSSENASARQHRTSPVLIANSQTSHGGARPKQAHISTSNHPLSASSSGEVSDYQTPPSFVSPPMTHKKSLSPSLDGSRSHSKRCVSTGSTKQYEQPTPPENYEELRSKLEEVNRIEHLQTQGAELAKLFKRADQDGFDLEAVAIALTASEDMSVCPLEYLQVTLASVVEKATKVGTEEEQNSVGELSISEAQAAYIQSNGNVEEAVKLCVRQRQELFALLSAMSDFPREEVLDAMLQSEGDLPRAEHLLFTSKLASFLERIWMQKDCRDGNRFALDNMAGEDIYRSISTSVINHQDFQNAIMDNNTDRDRRVRMILVEGKLKSWGRADMVIKILEEGFNGVETTLEDIVEAVRNCQDKTSALAYLQQECQICFTNFPMSKIRNLNVCQCKICHDCMVNNFKVAIREKHVHHWTCPVCSQPDLSNAEIASDYLQFLGMLLQPVIDAELLNLFEVKMRDWFLQNDANFRWCAHCAAGFIADNPRQLRMTCHQCGKKTCFRCKKQWEDQHEGLSCEDFNQWKIDNDPTNQSVGLAKHLDENGIDCPNCKMRFALAKGGCMHFKCPQCGHEFCSGCNQPYHHKNVCNKYNHCKQLGFHCHCPRDCFSNLRDYEVERLQKLLTMFAKPFNVAVPEDQENATKCPVMEQKEFDTSKKDEKCGKDAVEGYAGLCELHYKEYLTGIINQHGLDPVCIMTMNEMVVLLNKCDIVPPKQKPNETPEAHVKTLTQVIKEKLPLRQPVV